MTASPTTALSKVQRQVVIMQKWMCFHHLQNRPSKRNLLQDSFDRCSCECGNFDESTLCEICSHSTDIQIFHHSQRSIGCEEAMEVVDLAGNEITEMPNERKKKRCSSGKWGGEMRLPGAYMPLYIAKSNHHMLRLMSSEHEIAERNDKSKKVINELVVLDAKSSPFSPLRMLLCPSI